MKWRTCPQMAVRPVRVESRPSKRRDPLEVKDEECSRGKGHKRHPDGEDEPDPLAGTLGNGEQSEEKEQRGFDHPCAAGAAHEQHKEEEGECREAADSEKTAAFSAQENRGGEDHHAAAGILLGEDPLPVGGMAGGKVEAERRVQNDERDGGNGEGDHRHAENGELMRLGVARGEPESEQAGEGEGNASTQGEKRIKGPGCGCEGERAHPGGNDKPGEFRHLAEKKARAPQDECEHGAIRDRLGSDATDRRESTGGRAGHL